ncbi:hypothetical protein [Paenibacillus sp. 453mf]|uniref:hypothetical protein n=1 Tax=Paenibacillus sp. 453mf TaxID=1761874 RepID=UPI0008EA1F20|nr:hypothetical protein [Paenibacillus sp. 453mf]SFS81447.1 hypothetical protein SAMN04488601_10439 [Paenibacillus sp. 453mf]
MSKKRGIIMTAVGAGVTYLMRNKKARDKLFTSVSNMMRSSRSSHGGKKVPRVDLK